jgi:Trk-type K+ transport system membrane component
VKALLTLFMILGRLEFYAVVALFVPGFWRR